MLASLGIYDPEGLLGRNQQETIYYVTALLRLTIIVFLILFIKNPRISRFYIYLACLLSIVEPFTYASFKMTHNTDVKFRIMVESLTFITMCVDF